MSTQNHEEFEQNSRPQPSVPSAGEVVAKSLVKGAAFGVGMALGGPVGGLLALIIFGGGGDGDIDVGA